MFNICIKGKGCSASSVVSYLQGERRLKCRYYNKLKKLREKNYFRESLQVAMKKYILPFVLFAIIFCPDATAQSDHKNNEQEAIQNAFIKHIGVSAPIFRGPAYVQQTYLMKGSPFWGSDTLTVGRLIYDGLVYENVPLQWDVFQNYVLTTALNTSSKIVLRNDLIESFSVAGRVVKHFTAQKEQNLQNAGFYEVLYDGPTQILSRRRKTNEAKIEGRDVIYHFMDKSVYYVRMNGMYHLVSGKKDVLELFDRHRPEIKKQVRREHLRWKKNMEKVLLIAARIHDKTPAVP